MSNANPTEKNTASASVMAALEEWLPVCIRQEPQEVIDTVMPVALDVMNTVDLTSIEQGKDELRTLTSLLLYAYETYHTLDIEEVLTLEFIEFFIANVHIGEQNDNTRRTRRTTLKRIARAANPDDWQVQQRTMGSITVSDAYSASEEASLKLAGELVCQQGKTDQAFAVCGSLGAGLIGPEIETATGKDVVDLGSGRLGIWVVRKNRRLVPVRSDYTELMSELCRLADGARFLHQNHKNAAHCVAERVRLEGLGSLSYPRARSTWITAHLLAGTPLASLRGIAGPLAAHTLNGLLKAAAQHLSPWEAAQEGLRA